VLDNTTWFGMPPQGEIYEVPGFSATEEEIVREWRAYARQR